MNNIDEQIRHALNSEEQAMMGDPGDGLRIDQLILSPFRSRNWFITAIAMVYTLVFLGLAIFCAVRFFDASETKILLAWGFGFSFCMLAVSMLKMWFWMEMQRIAVTREVKRVQLLSARLLHELHAVRGEKEPG
ncbi:MAG: hypothetical protein KC996_01735 [Phycisphaerales bacterium]|nr:hypothetical protein [Phycisphaerales bacterium]